MKRIVLFLLFFMLLTNIFECVTISQAAGPVRGGKNGWLFYYDNGDGTTLYDYKGVNHYSPLGLHRVARNLSAAKQAVARKGCKFVAYMAPNKETIYSQYMPSGIKRKTTYTRCDQLYDYLVANTDLDVGYPKSEMMKEKNNYQLYYPNDTHWNRQGQFIGVQELLDITDGKRTSIHDVRFRVAKKYYGDLCRLSGGKYKFTTKHYKLASKVKRADKSSQRIFIVGDSFGHRLAISARKYYKKVRFCHINNFRMSQVRKGETVVWEVVERYQDKFSRINFAGR